MNTRKFLVMTLGLLLAGGVKAEVEINEATFPDAGFRSALSNMEEGKDGILTDEEIDRIGALTLTSRQHWEIHSLQGIEHLRNLTVLQFTLSQLNSLDLTKNKALRFVDCGFSTIEELNLSGLQELETLICWSTALRSVDVSGCTALRYLDCKGGQLTELDLSQATAIETLICTNNRLERLNVSGCAALETLCCDMNRLQTIDLTSCAALRDADCTMNRLTTLDLAGNTRLERLVCCRNQITGEGMSALVNSLPVVPKGELYVVDLSEDDERNYCTKGQADVARSKNWTVYQMGVEGLSAFEGFTAEDPSGIETVSSGRETTDSGVCYDLNGRRLSGTASGIYIRGNRKYIEH